MNLKKILSLSVLAATLFAGSFLCDSESAFAKTKISVPEFTDDLSYKDKADAAIKDYLKSLPKASGDYQSLKQPILIQGAMNSEIEKLIRVLKNPVVYNYRNFIYFAGTYKDYPVVISRTEQGLSNSAVATILAVEKFNPIVVINQGTAGSHTPSVSVGEIVVGERYVPISAVKTNYQPVGTGVKYEEQELRGTYAYNENVGEFTLEKEYSGDKKMIEIAEELGKTTPFSVVFGTIGSADAWYRSVDHVNFMNKTYGTLCEDMETQSVAQVCKNVGLPFVGIRVMSDNITVDEKYYPSTANICQQFILLFTDKYISDVLTK